MANKYEDLLKSITEIEARVAKEGLNEEIELMSLQTEQDLIELLNNTTSRTQEDAIINALNRLENLKPDSGLDDDFDDEPASADDHDFLFQDNQDEDFDDEFGSDNDDYDRY